MIATLSAVDYLQRKKTIFLKFLILPAINIILLSFISSQYSSEFSFKAATATVMLSGFLIALETFTTLLFGDRKRGIDRLMLAQGGFNYYYWLTKIIIVSFVTIILVLVNLLFLYLLGGDLVPLRQAFSVFPLFLLYGIVLGFAAFVLAWQLDNPYFFSNLISASSLVLAGVIIPISAYPPVFAKLSYLLPLARTMAYLYGEQALWQIDFIIMLIWLVIAIVVYFYQINIVLKKQNKSLF